MRSNRRRWIAAAVVALGIASATGAQAMPGIFGSTNRSESGVTHVTAVQSGLSDWLGSFWTSLVSVFAADNGSITPGGGSGN